MRSANRLDDESWNYKAKDWDYEPVIQCHAGAGGLATLSALQPDSFYCIVLVQTAGAEKQQ